MRLFQFALLLIALYLFIKPARGAEELDKTSLSSFERRAFAELRIDYLTARSQCNTDECRLRYAALLETLDSIEEEAIASKAVATATATQGGVQ